MKHIWFLLFLFSQSVLAYERQTDFGRKISDEKNPKFYAVLYKGTDGDSCFLDPGIFQKWSKNDNLIELVNEEDLCNFSFSEEEDIIQGIVKNASAGQSVIGIIRDLDGDYFLTPVEIIPVQGFQPAGFTLTFLAGSAVFTLPPGWVALIAVGTVVGGQQLYANRESLLEQARKTIDTAKMLLALNRELVVFKPLESLRLDIDHWRPKVNHLVNQSEQEEQQDQRDQWERDFDHDEGIFVKVYETAKAAKQRELKENGETIIKDGKVVARPLRPEELSQIKAEVEEAIREIREFEVGCKRDLTQIQLDDMDGDCA